MQFLEEVIKPEHPEEPAGVPCWQQGKIWQLYDGCTFAWGRGRGNPHSVNMKAGRLGRDRMHHISGLIDGGGRAAGMCLSSQSIGKNAAARYSLR